MVVYAGLAHGSHHLGVVLGSIALGVQAHIQLVLAVGIAVIVVVLYLIKTDIERYRSIIARLGIRK